MIPKASVFSFGRFGDFQARSNEIGITIESEAQMVFDGYQAFKTFFDSLGEVKNG